jgi:branched-chain amino acid transport system substrate-binding protein
MGFTRRQVLGALGGVVAGAAGGRRGWAAEKSPVRVGFLAPLTGPFAQLGKDMWDGFRLYFEEIGMQAAGRRIEILSEDTWVEPAEALTKLRKLVEKDRIHVAAGGLTAPTGYALQPYVEAQRLPFLVPISCSDDLTQRKIGKWYVRVGWTCSQPTHPLGDYAFRVLGYRKVVGLNFDLGSGYESLGGFQRVFEEQGGQIIQRLWAPLTVADFAPYLAQIKREADAVYAFFAGSAAIRLVKQYQEYGLKGRIPLIGLGTLTDESVLPSMGDEAVGVVSALHYSEALDSPANKRFKAAYEKIAGRIPSYYSASCYSTARWIVEGLKAVGGDAENKDRYLAALKQVEVVDDPRGPVKIDQWGGAVQNIYIRRVERVGGRLQNTVIHTYPNISQFWSYKPEDFLKNPVYDRDKYPGCKFCL